MGQRQTYKWNRLENPQIDPYMYEQYTALMYSFSYLEPVCCSMSSSNCCFLTCIQIYQEAGQLVWYSQKVKEDSEKVGLKLNIQKNKSWHLVPSLHGKQMGKQWQTLFFGGSKITADGDYSHEIKRHLLLGRKVRTNIDSI